MTKLSNDGRLQFLADCGSIIGRGECLKIGPHWSSFAFEFQRIIIGLVNFERRVVSLFFGVDIKSCFSWELLAVVCSQREVRGRKGPSNGWSPRKVVSAKSPLCGLNGPQPWEWIWPQITFPPNVSKCHFFTAPRRRIQPIAKFDRVWPQQITLSLEMQF